MSTEPSVGNITIKSVWKNDFRRFLFSKTSKFEELKKLLVKTYTDSLPSSFCVKYEDDEGELCTITSDVELLEALHICEREKRGVLKLSLSAFEVDDSMEIDAESKATESKKQETEPKELKTEGVSKKSFTLQQFVEKLGTLIQDSKVQAALPTAVNAALASLETASSLQELVGTGVNTSPYLKSHVLVKEMLSQLASVPAEANQKFQLLKSNPMAISMIRTYLPQAVQNLPMLVPMLPMFLEYLSSGQRPFGPFGHFDGMGGMGFPGMGFPFPPPFPHPHPPHHPGPHHGGPFGHGPGPFVTSHGPGPFTSHGPFHHDGPHFKAPSTPESKEQIHSGVRCDGCDCEPIRGVRFKCSVCANYDLCDKCEAKNIHPEHPFIKIRDAERTSDTASDSQSEASSQSESPWGRHWRWWGRGRRGHGMHGMHHGWHGMHGGRGRFHSLFGSQGQDWRGRCRGEKGEKLKGKFVENVTIPERAVVLPGQTLIKTWRVENVGTTDWPEGSKLIFFRGDRSMSTEEEFPVSVCKAGQSVEVSAVILTPTEPGRHTAVFRLADAERMPFGPRLWCDVVIPDPSGAPKDPLPSAPTDTVMSTSSETKVSPSAPTQPTQPTQQHSKSAPNQLTQPVKYTIQLRALESMGFVDLELNKQLLEKHNGNVQTVCEYLLQQNFGNNST